MVFADKIPSLISNSAIIFLSCLFCSIFPFMMPCTCRKGRVLCVPCKVFQYDIPLVYRCSDTPDNLGYHLKELTTGILNDTKEKFIGFFQPDQEALLKNGISSQMCSFCMENKANTRAFKGRHTYWTNESHDQSHDKSTTASVRASHIPFISPLL